ncbi:MAG: insulinase family protein [Desulfuromonadaceae bacterium]|nr:insulinase family protein [Desulfuromonadaceae bacterium]
MVQKTVLDNGVRVLTEDIPHSQTVSIGFFIGRGSRHERPEESGMTHFIEHLLFRGRGLKTSLATAKEVDRIGGPLNGFTGRDYSCFYLQTLPENVPQGIALLSRLLFETEFDAQAVEKERAVILQELHALRHNADEYIHDFYMQTCWRDHGLGRPVLGTEEGLRSIQTADVTRFLDEHYRSCCHIVSVAGCIDHGHIVTLLQSALECLSPYSPVLVRDEPRNQGGVAMKPTDDTLLHLCLGIPALSQAHPNRFANLLLNAIFGGGMSSRLFQHIREQCGWAYHTYSYLNCYADAGTMVASVTTTPEHGVQVVEAICQELTALKSGDVDEDELAAACSQLQGRLRMAQDSAHARMERLAVSEFYHGHFVTVDEVLRALSRVTVRQLQQLASYLVQPDATVLCAVGNIDDRLQKLHNASLLS